MPRGSHYKVIYRDETEHRVAAGEDLHGVMQRYVDDIADDASRGAPRSEGAGHARGTHGADNIVGVVDRVPEGWRGRVGWYRKAYYLGFHEKGTQHMPARPFLVPAAERRRASL